MIADCARDSVTAACSLSSTASSLGMETQQQFWGWALIPKGILEPPAPRCLCLSLL